LAALFRAASSVVKLYTISDIPVLTLHPAETGIELTLFAAISPFNRLSSFSLSLSIVSRLVASLLSWLFCSENLLR
jgi:hypothetical protein